MIGETVDLNKTKQTKDLDQVEDKREKFHLIMKDLPKISRESVKTLV